MSNNIGCGKVNRFIRILFFILIFVALFLDVVYKYQWYKISAPEKSHGYMEGKDSSRLILTKLDIPGVYQFKVTVSTLNGLRQGDGFVNVTVKPAPRVNHAPRAEIQPKEVTLQLPNNEAVLDGSSKWRLISAR